MSRHLEHLQVRNSVESVVAGQSDDQSHKCQVNRLQLWQETFTNVIHTHTLLKYSTNCKMAQEPPSIGPRVQQYDPVTDRGEVMIVHQNKPFRVNSRRPDGTSYGVCCLCGNGHITIPPDGHINPEAPIRGCDETCEPSNCYLSSRRALNKIKYMAYTTPINGVELERSVRNELDYMLPENAVNNRAYYPSKEACLQIISRTRRAALPQLPQHMNAWEGMVEDIPARFATIQMHAGEDPRQ